MKSSNSLLKKFRYGDFLIVGSVVFFVILLFGFSFFSSSQRLTAEIYLDGEKITSVKLYEINKSELVEAGDCILLAENDGITFTDSACPDKLCIKRGKLKKAGDTMACVPERVTVVLKGASDDKIDGVVY